MQYEAFLDALRAAARVETDEVCEFDTDEWGDCQNEAVWLIEYEAVEGPRGMLICQRCSSRGWIYARENELDFGKVSQETKDRFSEEVKRFVPLEEYANERSVEKYNEYHADKPPWAEVVYSENA